MDHVYVLQCEGDSGDSKQLFYFNKLEDAIAKLYKYLQDEYGDDYETDVFESVITYKDPEYCGGVMIETIDMEGSAMRSWIQKVPAG